MKKQVFNNYADAIAKQFHLSLDEIFTKTKRRDIVDARQMLYWNKLYTNFYERLWL